MNIALKITAMLLLAMTLAVTADARRGRGSDDDDGHRHGRGHDDHCTDAARSEWKPIADFAAKAKEMGYTVTKVEISGTCYEVYGTKDDANYELYFDPKSGELVKTGRD
jgi:hypothetical protein